MDIDISKLTNLDVSNPFSILRSVRTKMLEEVELCERQVATATDELRDSETELNEAKEAVATMDAFLQANDPNWITP